MLKHEVVNAIVDVLEEYKVGSDLPIEINGEETILFGSNSVLDSFSLVAVIVEIEDKIHQITNQEIILSDEKAMSQKNSPFRTIGTLSEYILVLLGGEINE